MTSALWMSRMEENNSELPKVLGQEQVNQSEVIMVERLGFLYRFSTKALTPVCS